jgi:predicted signal transduction protein with EAL and GGDEF domain
MAAGDADAIDLARRANDVITPPLVLSEHSLTVRISIGMSVTPIETYDAARLLKEADLALYAAKNDGLGAFRQFDPAMQRAVLFRRSIEQDLHAADFDREFHLVYQPIVSLKKGRIVGAEALLRWMHPLRGEIRPDRFIPIAEQSGVICQLGEKILQSAFSAACKWPHSTRLAVNLSPRQLMTPGFAKSLLRFLEKSGLPPTRLELEVTETALIRDAEVSRAVLQAFAEAGIGIALDDFGTGYSSLSHIRNFPISKVKIDRSFVRDALHVAEAGAIVRAVLGLARDLGLESTAEGVETEEQLNWLQAEGASQAQGYYFGRPMQLSDFEKLLVLADDGAWPDVEAIRECRA